MIFNYFFDKKFFKFLIVGIINTVTGSAIMFMLYNAAHLSYWVSSVCNYAVTSILSFFLNKYFTFKVRKWSVLMAFSFILTIAFSYITAYGISKPLINFLLSGFSVRLRENTALFTGMCLFTVINYTGQRFIVFKKNE
ncbi:MAG: GtrA family protein [Treponema sp.]|jgi:putative flippase GtrA|nr:GtrA family protein [Treponema sp.]